jgi:prepilin-type N-terminal cleavage/methylation domain-containing protein
MVQRRRPGFSLLEVIVVMAILLMISAACYPTLKSSYGYFKLNGGIDSVRAAWAQARAHAIEQGRPYRFSVEPGGSHFRVAPDRPDYWGGSAPSDDPDGKGMVLEQALPGGVRFTVNGDGGTPPPADSDKEVPANYSSIGWSTTVVFLPDGTAREDVRILFQVQGVQPTLVHLRGLTGSVTVQRVSK